MEWMLALFATAAAAPSTATFAFAEPSAISTTPFVFAEPFAFSTTPASVEANGFTALSRAAGKSLSVSSGAMASGMLVSSGTVAKGLSVSSGAMAKGLSVSSGTVAKGLSVSSGAVAREGEAGEQTATSSSSLLPLPASVSEPAIKTELGAELFARARATKSEGNSFEKSYALNRARLSFTIRYRELLRITLEPDFSSALCQAGGALCDDAELSDAFAEVTPLEELDFRIGQAKTPFGALESISAWKLPAHRRGLVNELASNRLRFGGRKLGIKSRVRLKDLPLKPTIELGAYADADRAYDEDFAMRTTLKPWKGGELELQAYLERDATTNGDVAPAAAIAATHDKGPILAIAEAMIGRGRLLTRTGEAGRDATFLAIRLIAAYAIALDENETLELAPYAGFDGFDPNTRTKNDAGYEIKGGLNFYVEKMFRVSLEASRRRGELAFPAPNATVFSMLLGASL